jgi:hypothetical protein
MAEMKLIMERWDSYLNEQWSDCPTNAYTLQDVAIAFIGTISDEKQKAQVIKDLSQKLGRDVTKTLDKVEPVTGVLGATAAFVVPAVAVGTTASGAIVVAGLIAAAAAMTANLISASWNKKIDQNKTEIRQLMNLFCIDDETLDMISDDIEKKYYAESDIFDEIERLYTVALNQAQDMPIPDLTKHLVDWVNDKTTYKQSDASAIEMKR